MVVSNAASQQEGPGCKSTLTPFCVEFAGCPCVCVGSPWVVWLSGDSKLTVGVNVTEWLPASAPMTAPGSPQKKTD